MGFKRASIFWGVTDVTSLYQTLRFLGLTGGLQEGLTDGLQEGLTDARF